MELRNGDYHPNEEQSALQATFEQFFRQECPTTRVRRAEPLGFDRALWERLRPLRAIAMSVPEGAGGDGAGLVETSLVTEQLGRRVAPVPLIENVVAARALSLADGDSAQMELDAMLNEGKIVSFALHNAMGPQLVPAGAVAEGVVGLVGTDLVFVRTTEPNPHVPNHGSSPLAWLDLGSPDLERVCLTSGQAARQAYSRARREWKLLTASALIGMAQGVLDIGVEHARTRVAFGAPIGTFQAVSHPLVNVAMGVETGRRLVAKGSWYHDHEPESRPDLATTAYLFAEETAMHAASVAMHVLGGVGFTLESDLQLYYRRVKGWSLVGGDSEEALGDLADDLFGPVLGAS
jgi:alkylation response protein AidB-like acyl-CoA dehydrogenase